jgi:PAS domain S-box-containing protein
MPLSRERLEQLIEHSSDIVIATDRTGHVSYYNDGAEASLGYSAKEVHGKFADIFYPDIAEARRVMGAMRSDEYGSHGSVETFRTQLISKAGEVIPVAISGSIIYDNDGEEKGTIGFLKDLREILRKDQLATLGEVAIGLSHEINNPLAVVLNQVELLEAEIFDLAGERDCSEEIERLDSLRREVARIGEILTRLGEMVEDERYETVDYIGPSKMIDLRSETRRGPSMDNRLQGLRVLVVDDDQGVCRSICEILEKEGCSVCCAGDGVEALERLEMQEYDAVLSDVLMPRMDGHDLYLEVKERYPNLPIMMMTAFHYDKDHIIKRSRIEGLTGIVFKKPVDPDRLRKALLEVSGRAVKGS